MSRNVEEQDLSSQSSVTTDDQDESWDDWQEEPVQARSLFDDNLFNTPEQAIEHDKLVHGFDLILIALSLDFFERIRLINWIRTTKPDPKSLARLDRNSSFLDDDAFLKPVLQDDVLLPRQQPELALSYAEVDFDNLSLGNAVASTSSGVNVASVNDTSSQHELVDTLRAQLADAEQAMSQLKTIIRDRLGDKMGLDQAGAADGQVDKRAIVKQDLSGKGKQPADKPERDDDTHYFESYAYNEIHEIMLKDKVRTDSYRDFILNNPSIFKGAVVLDVGCGSGILSMFAAKAGAKKVYAVDASAVAFKAERNIKANGLSDVIQVVKGKVENIELPEKVDVIVSEWMGYFLLYECMLDSVLHARDRFLKPSGIMAPSQTSIMLSLFGGGDSLIRDRIDFWNDVYGFKMNTMKDEIYDEALIDIVRGQDIVSDEVSISDIVTQTVTVPELTFSNEFELTAATQTRVYAFLGHFDTFFTTDGRKADAKQGADGLKQDSEVFFSTGARVTPTHWKQTVFLLKEPFNVEQGSKVNVTWSVNGGATKAQVWKPGARHASTVVSPEPCHLIQSESASFKSSMSSRTRSSTGSLDFGAATAADHDSMEHDDDDEDHSMTDTTGPESSAFKFDEEPSFSSGHVYTSTPSKTRRLQHQQLQRQSSSTERVNQHDDDRLKHSDTESLDEQDLDQAGIQIAQRAHSTVPRRAPHNEVAAQPFARAPSPSTGSSTLVDEWPRQSLTRTIHREKGKTRALQHFEPPLNSSAAVAIAEEHGDDTHVDNEDDDASSSSPRPFRSRTSTRRDLSSYLESRSSTIKTPPPFRKSHPLPSQTPHAPGAFPSTLSTRNRTLRQSVPESTRSTMTTSATPGSGTKQIQDAFHRFIHGPDGALTQSAEKRAALAAALSASAQKQSPYGNVKTSPREEKGTPHPAGFYAFTPKHALPVSKRSSGTARTRQHDVSNEEDEPERGDDSPSARAKTYDTKLERTLRHIRELQRETEMRQSHEPDEVHLVDNKATRQQRPERAYEGDDSSSAAEESEQSDSAPIQAQRSAIEFAMARSFALPQSSSTLPIGETSNERLAVPPTPPLRSSPSKNNRRRVVTPPSPGLPELPPSITPSPQSSPTQVRELPRRSPHTRQSSSMTVQQQQSPRHQASSSTRQTENVMQKQTTKVSPKSLRSSQTRSPSRSPTSTRVQESIHDISAEDSLSAIVAELASAVRALKEPTIDQNDLPTKIPTSLHLHQNPPSILTELLTTRKSESDKRRQTLETELNVLDSETNQAMEKREVMLDQLLEAQTIEATLSSQIDQLRQSVERMGIHAADVVRETLQTESRKRTQWFVVAFLIQLVLFLLMLRIAQTRSEYLYETLYYDPFNPALAPSSHWSLSSDMAGARSLLPETLQLFATDGHPNTKRGTALVLAGMRWWRNMFATSSSPNLAAERFSIF
ncbi:hypothetical protein OIO90_005130 [Microbotryomycetes sp. JL221]|nr:hypothetical protein OIO90_005130 [Microbotryomycetes sp. JL221]